MAPKTATKPASGDVRGFTLTADLIGKPIATGKVEIEQRRVSQKYVPLINAVLGMTEGQTIVVKVPKDSTIEKFRASVTTTLRKRLSDKLGKNKMQFGQTKDGELAISVVKA